LAAFWATSLPAACAPAPSPTAEPTKPAGPAAPAATKPAAAPTLAPTAAPTTASAASTAPTAAASPKPAAPGKGVVSLVPGGNFAARFTPLKICCAIQQEAVRKIFEPLTMTGPGLTRIGRLAERWEISKDATTFTYFLRRGLTWSDGQPLTARDVAFTYRLALTKAVASGTFVRSRVLSLRGGKDFYDGKSNEIPGLQVLDDYTIRFVLEKPNVEFARVTETGIVPEHVLKDMVPGEIDQHPFTAKPMVGSGAYQFVQYAPDQFIELKANPNFYLGAPKIEKLFIRLPQPQVAIAQLEKGEVDFVAKLSPIEAQRLKENPSLNIVSSSGIGMFQIAIQTDRIPDKRVRQAMMYAIDRKGLLKTVLLGQGRLVHAPIFGPEWAVFDDLNPYDYNPAKAKELLKEAKWDSNRELELIWAAGYPGTDQSAPVVQQQFQEVGIKLKLTPMDNPAYLKRDEAGDYELAWFGGGSYALDPDIANVYYNNATKKDSNTRYGSPELDELFEKGRSTSDVNERRKFYHDAAKILNEDVPTIYFWSEDFIVGYAKRLQNVKPVITDMFWNLHEWAEA
jgi:peptide/nickel transport system substrate-binding protein